MVINVNWTYCSDHFAMHTSIKSICCTPEANTMVCQLSSNKKIEKLERKQTQNKREN